MTALANECVGAPSVFDSNAFQISVQSYATPQWILGTFTAAQMWLQLFHTAADNFQNSKFRTPSCLSGASTYLDIVTCCRMKHQVSVLFEKTLNLCVCSCSIDATLVFHIHYCFSCLSACCCWLCAYLVCLFPSPPTVRGAWMMRQMPRSQMISPSPRIVKARWRRNGDAQERQEQRWELKP